MKKLDQLDRIVRSLDINPLIQTSANEHKKQDKEQLVKLNKLYGNMQNDFLSLIEDCRERLKSDPSLTEQLTDVLKNAVQLLESKPILLAAINGAYQSMKGAMLDISPGTPVLPAELRGYYRQDAADMAKEIDNRFAKFREQAEGNHSLLEKITQARQTIKQHPDRAQIILAALEIKCEEYADVKKAGPQSRKG